MPRSTARPYSTTAAICGALASTWAIIALTACSPQADTSDPLAGTQTPRAQSECEPAAGQPPSPTVDLLKGLLDKGMDPAVPADSKVQLVQGTEADPGMFDRVGNALREAGFQSEIHSVTDYCNNTANADASITIYGETTESQVPLVAEDGVWKLDKGWACGLAKSLQQDSPICS